MFESRFNFLPFSKEHQNRENTLETLQTSFIDSVKEGKLENTKMVMEQASKFRSSRVRKSANEVLIISGFDINLQDEAGLTALHWATINGNISMMQLLLIYNADIDIPDIAGQTVFHKAAAHSNPKVLEALMNHYETCLDLSDRSKPYPKSPLSEAITNLRIENVALLLKCGARVDRPINQLHYLINHRWSHEHNVTSITEIASLLMHYGARVSLREKSSQQFEALPTAVKEAINNFPGQFQRPLLNLTTLETLIKQYAQKCIANSMASNLGSAHIPSGYECSKITTFSTSNIPRTQDPGLYIYSRL